MSGIALPAERVQLEVYVEQMLHVAAQSVHL